MAVGPCSVVGSGGQSSPVGGVQIFITVMKPLPAFSLPTPQNSRGAHRTNRGGDADLDFMHMGTLYEMEVVLIQQGAVTAEPCWPLWPEVNVAKPAEAIQGAGGPPRA